MAENRLELLRQREQAHFVTAHPRSIELARRNAAHYLYGLPMHWMRDWPSPVALHVTEARGAELVCADGLRYADFCLGDTGAMFGHSPAPVAAAIAAQAARGLTAMLPADCSAEVGTLLTARFGLPRWQLALSASDANRFMLRWARAVTARPKVLVFEGCYHGTVDDTLVDLDPATGATLTRASLLGQVHDLAAGTRVVPFNDLAALQAALAPGDVACLLAEPALTNCGLVLPESGFWAAAQAACRAAGTLLLLDETHTLSTGPGGYTRVHGLQPDALIVGKAIAGGLPCAVYGVTDELAGRMEAAKHAAPEGHSGIGTTLSASLLTLHALHASLRDLVTEAGYVRMQAGADQLEAGLQALIRRHALPWSVNRLGARMELQFCATPPRDARAARAAMDDALERCLHLWLLNRGVLVTPFHNMLLVSPETRIDQIGLLLEQLESFVQQLSRS